MKKQTPSINALVNALSGVFKTDFEKTIDTIFAEGELVSEYDFPSVHHLHERGEENHHFQCGVDFAVNGWTELSAHITGSIQIQYHTHPEDVKMYGAFEYDVIINRIQDVWVSDGDELKLETTQSLALLDETIRQQLIKIIG